MQGLATGEQDSCVDDTTQVPVKFCETDLDFSRETVEITRDISLCFDLDVELGCERLVIRDAVVCLTKLNLKGAIVVIHGCLKISDSHIHDPGDSMDYIMSAEMQSCIEATNCRFTESERFGVCADSESDLTFRDCVISDVKLFGVIVSSFSKFTISDSRFVNMDGDSIMVTDRCRAVIRWCEFSGRQKRALTVNHAEYVRMDGTRISNCSLSSVFVSVCDEFIMNGCTITDCQHTAVYLDNMTGLIEDTVVKKAEGNGINVSHSSKCVIRRCKIQNTLFPAIALCDGSFGKINSCRMSESEMCGMVVRGNSKALIEDSTITDAKLFGVSVSDSQSVSMEKCSISKCQHAAIACYNRSEVRVKQMEVTDCKDGISVFTGGHAIVNGMNMKSISGYAVWVHHAGTGSFDHIDWVSREGSESKELFKVETKQHVEAFQCTVDGVATSDIEGVETEEILDHTEPTPAHCKLCGVVCRDSLFDRCGHIVYCRACWEGMDEKPELCSLCLMPVSNIVAPINCSHGEEEGTCSVCFTDPIDTVIMPCGHMTCSSCANRWFSANSGCPFCRERNARPQKVVPYE